MDVKSAAMGLRKSNNIVKKDFDTIMDSVPVSNRQEASRLLRELADELSKWEGALDKMDAETIVDEQNHLLNISGQIQVRVLSHGQEPCTNMTLRA